MRVDWREAAIAGGSETIARLLADGEDINKRDRYGQTALMLAAVNGRDEIVGLLLAKGAALNVTAKYGLTALMLAVINHHAGVAKQLVDAGADLTVRGSAAAFAGKTAGDLANDQDMNELAAYIARAEQLEGRDG